MEFKGTKGKWEVNPRASRNVRCGNVTIANCSSGQNGENEEEEIANAKLISSAPEMLEMLNKVNDFIIKNKSQNYMVELLRREIPDIEQLLTKITTL